MRKRLFRQNNVFYYIINEKTLTQNRKLNLSAADRKGDFMHKGNFSPAINKAVKHRSAV